VTEEEWLRSANPEEMLWALATQFPAGREYHGFPSYNRKLRLFAIACCRHVGHLLTEPRSWEALAVIERYADQLASEKEKAAAQKTSLDAWLKLERAKDGCKQAALAVHLAIDDIVDGSNAASSVADQAMLAAQVAAGEPEEARGAVAIAEETYQATLLREIFGNPFRPVSFSPSWRTDTALSLARQMYEAREFSAMPILADALQDAGCDRDELLARLRDPHATHVRGCWALDLVLGKQ
jgi:hypothetical protein